MTFDELFKDHNLTAAEREALVAYLASVRAQKTVKALAEPPERAELRRLAAHLHELRELLDRRPAINQGLFEAYQKWSGEVYALDWLNALDAPPAI